MSTDRITPALTHHARVGNLRAILGLLYSGASYAFFLMTFVYLALFSDGVLVPKSVDTGAPGDPLLAVVVNLSLLLLFGVQHSVMARASFKQVLTRVVPAHLERATFVLASSVVLVLLMRLWRPLPSVIWNVESSSLVATLWTLNAVGWLGVPVCSYMIDHFDLFGLKQPLQHFRRVTVARQGFVTPLLYKYVRHPMMTFFLLGLWATPSMTVGHMVLSLGMTLYIMVGVHFEERALRRELGEQYVRYQESTPKFFPVGMRQVEAPGRTSAIRETR
jgi:methanethiol S-methyltransferase